MHQSHNDDTQTSAIAEGATLTKPKTAHIPACWTRVSAAGKDHVVWDPALQSRPWKPITNYDHGSRENVQNAILVQEPKMFKALATSPMVPWRWPVGCWCMSYPSPQSSCWLLSSCSSTVAIVFTSRCAEPVLHGQRPKLQINLGQNGTAVLILKRRKAVGMTEAFVTAFSIGFRYAT